MKKITIIVVICTILFICLVGCSINKNTEKTTYETIEQIETVETTSYVEQITENIDTTIVDTMVETTNIKTTQSETTIPAETTNVIVVDNTVHDPSNHKVGSYVNLVYDDYYCDVKYNVKKELGTKENISLNVTMKNGYFFGGIYINGLADNNLLTNNQVYDFIVSDDTTIYINYTVKVIYHTNTNVDRTIVDFYPISYYKCPVALDANNFSNVGYVLSEYKTEDDYYVSPGSRFPANKPIINVYCIWEKVSPSSDFIIDGSTLKKYIGTSSNVVIPETINTIDSGAFDKNGVERIFIPKTVRTINDYALTADSIKEIVIHDSVRRMSINGITCDNLKSIRINSIYGFYKESSENGDVFATNNKYDRLLWAKDFKKIVIYGASGSLYGWDCEKLDEAFGDEYVIINLGMNANMSASIVFEGITPLLNEDDILLWACEPGNKVLGDTRFDYLQTWWFTGAYFDLYKNIDISNYQNFFEYFAEYNNQKSRNNVSYKYSDVNRENIYGDNIKVRTNNFYACDPYVFDYFTGYNYKHMSSLIKQMNKKGVKVLFTYAAYIEGISPDSDLEYYKKKILENFAVTIISDYKKCRYPITYFWDSAWHLTNEGSTLRTLQVIEDLKTYLI